MNKREYYHPDQTNSPNNQEILLFGNGRIGKATAFFLKKAGLNYTTYDVAATKPDSVISLNEKSFKKTLLKEIQGGTNIIVISALANKFNFPLAKVCSEINSNLDKLNEQPRNVDLQPIQYFDFGGDESVSEQIKSLPVLDSITDCGLAPGFVNELIKYEIKEGDNVSVFCGGIPLYPDKYKYRYFTTWSLDGLKTSYTKNVSYLDKGEIKTIDKSKDFETWTQLMFESQAYQAIPTHGGIYPSLNEHRFTKNSIAYYTLRHFGHYEKLAQDTKNFTKFSKKVIQELQPRPHYDKDQVLIRLKIQNKDKHKIIDYRFVSKYKGFSAMQVATACGMVSKILSSLDVRNYFWWFNHLSKWDI